jgi:hypothetical protein
MIRDNLQRRLTWQTGMVCGSSRQRAAELARSVTAAANEIQPRARRNLLLGHLKVHGRSMSSQVQPTNRPTCMCEMRCCEECCEICCIDCCCFIPVFCLYLPSHSASVPNPLLRWQTHTPTAEGRTSRKPVAATPRLRLVPLSLHTSITLSVSSLSLPLLLVCRLLLLFASREQLLFPPKLNFQVNLPSVAV